MDFNETLFLIQLVGMLGMFFWKLYNIFDYVGNLKKKDKEPYNMKLQMLLFIGFIMSWGIGFFTVMFNITNMLFITLFKFETFFLVFNIVLLVIDLFLFKYETLILKPQEAYNSSKN